MRREFLPVTRQEMEERGILQPDFVYICGDAYVDHPSFGAAIITRLLESRGYSVCVISQPDWRRPESVQIFGEPRLAFLVSAGNMDSMVNHYAVSKKHRQKDSYSPGGKMGLRPDRAAIVYSNLIRQTYKQTPVILGGIEASLRRLAHYDYWDNCLRRSILLDCGADLISYGMGERSIVEIAEALDSGLAVRDLTFIPGTVYRAKNLDNLYKPIVLPSYEQMSSEREAYAKSFAQQYANADPFSGRLMAEPYGNQGFIVQNPPARPLSTEEMDGVYALPYARAAHPMYKKQGGIPALDEVEFSLTSSRGCFGGCNFCALTFHEGRVVQARSRQSLVEEAVLLTKEPGFKGYIHDVGGPTADFRKPACKKQGEKGACPNRQCLFPQPCENLEADHKDYVEVLQALRQIPGVKKVFVRSGIRFDYVLADPDRTFLRELVSHHVSGQLRVAPEHVSSRVLKVMGKPSHEVYERFLLEFEKENRRAGKKQYVVPYFMSSHPGCTMREAVGLAEYVRDMKFTPEQVQDFYPTPSTMSTCMYYTGRDPRTMEPVYVERDPHKKAIQRALIQYRNPANAQLVREGLQLAGREDLMGFGPKCLLRPSKGEKVPDPQQKQGKGKKKTIRNIHKKHKA